MVKLGFRWHVCVRCGHTVPVGWKQQRAFLDHHQDCRVQRWCTPVQGPILRKGEAWGLAVQLLRVKSLQTVPESVALKKVASGKWSTPLTDLERLALKGRR